MELRVPDTVTRELDNTGPFLAFQTFFQNEKTKQNKTEKTNKQTNKQTIPTAKWNRYVTCNIQVYRRRTILKTLFRYIGF